MPPITYPNGKKTLTVLGLSTAFLNSQLTRLTENEPEVMNTLARRVGLAPHTLEFHEIISLEEPNLLGPILRPVLALLVIIPMTPAWKAYRQAEDAEMLANAHQTADTHAKPIWFPQIIGNACGSIGLVHCLLNVPADAGHSHILPDSVLARIRDAAMSLKSSEDCAKLLYDDEEFGLLHQSVAAMGQSSMSVAEDGGFTGHFVAFVKGADGHFWELEGDRQGPVDLGVLEAEEDVLSARALAMGIGRIMALESNGGTDLRFSCLALTRK